MRRVGAVPDFPLDRRWARNQFKVFCSGCGAQAFSVDDRSYRLRCTPALSAVDAASQQLAYVRCF